MINLKDQDFNDFIQKEKKPVVVDFFATWCHGCQVLSPLLDKIAKEYEDRAVFAKVNVEEAPLESQKYGVERIPMVLLFKEGQAVTGFVGAIPENEIKKWLNENLGSEEEKMEQIIKNYEEYAKDSGIQLNPNREQVKGVIKGLLNNEKNKGARYCPCRRVSGSMEEDAPKICPCAWHMEEIKKDGHCLCRLFVKQ